MSKERLEEHNKELVNRIMFVTGENQILYKSLKKLEQQNKRYREAIKRVRYAIHTQISSINHQENTELENQYIRGMTFSTDMINRYFEALESESE